MSEREHIEGLHHLERTVARLEREWDDAAARLHDARAELALVAITLQHIERHTHPDGRQLFAFFFSPSQAEQNLGGFTMQIFSNDPKGLNLALAETLKGAPVPLSKGPFAVAISDPNNTIKVTPGSADQTTPDNYKPNGSGALGTVTVTVTDNAQTPPLVSAPVSFDVVAPTGGNTADALVASFVPAP
jgi:hypothetical protein